MHLSDDALDFVNDELNPHCYVYRLIIQSYVLFGVTCAYVQTQFG